MSAACSSSSALTPPSAPSAATSAADTKDKDEPRRAHHYDHGQDHHHHQQQQHRLYQPQQQHQRSCQKVDLAPHLDNSLTNAALQLRRGTDCSPLFLPVQLLPTLEPEPLLLGPPSTSLSPPPNLSVLDQARSVHKGTGGGACSLPRATTASPHVTAMQPRLTLPPLVLLPAAPAAAAPALPGLGAHAAGTPLQLQDRRRHQHQHQHQHQPAIQGRIHGRIPASPVSSQPALLSAHGLNQPFIPRRPISAFPSALPNHAASTTLTTHEMHGVHQMDDLHDGSAQVLARAGYHAGAQAAPTPSCSSTADQDLATASSLLGLKHHQHARGHQQQHQQPQHQQLLSHLNHQMIQCTTSCPAHSPVPPPRDVTLDSHAKPLAETQVQQPQPPLAAHAAAALATSKAAPAAKAPCRSRASSSSSSSSLSLPSSPPSPTALAAAPGSLAASVNASDRVCPVCQKEFFRSCHLRSHMRVHESLQQRFPCTSCDASFLRHHDLTRHMRIHQEDKRFVCHRCGKVFCRRDALSRHINMDPAIRQYRCVSSVFARKSTGRVGKASNRLRRDAAHATMAVSVDASGAPLDGMAGSAAAGLSNSDDMVDDDDQTVGSFSDEDRGDDRDDRDDDMQ